MTKREEDLNRYFELTPEERIEKYEAGIAWNDWSYEKKEEKQMKLTEDEKKELRKLMAMKEVIELEDDREYYISTSNKKTREEGTINFFTNGEKKVKVYEGDPDGSDDKEMSYEEFIKNYSFMLTFY